MTVKILWGSPLPPIRSGVSDYAMQLLPELARHCELRVLSPPEWEPTSELRALGLEMVEASAPLLEGELALVHLGNNPYHEWLLPVLNRKRVVVVLHDAVLHHLMVEATLSRDRRAEYESLLESAHGPAGKVLAVARRWGLTGRRDPFLFPARKAYLDGVSGVVVHSAWAGAEVTGDLPAMRVVELAMPMADPGELDRRQIRAKLGVPAESILLMHLGFVSPQKGLKDVLTGFAAAVAGGSDVRLVQVGAEGPDASRMREAASELGIETRVHSTGWVSDEEVGRLPAAADLGVVMRTPSAGETSAAAARFLACGTPFAVHGLHQYLEWPEAVAPRLTPGPSAAADLTRLLARVVEERDSGAWEGRRTAARRLYQERHRPERVAAQLLEYLEGL